MRVALLLEYDGGGYSGWQVQAGQDSVQARVEQALSRLFSTPIRLAAAGRTDAGVHALGQVAAFDPPRNCDLVQTQRALNALLPPDIVVRQACEVPARFDPRRDAHVRIYEYRIRNRALRSAFDYRHAWLVREPLDLDLMRAAARLFIGEHDFAAFRTLGTEVRSTVRRIYVSEWRGREDLTYRVEGSSFLRHMVRTMVAAMVDIGRHRRPVESIRELLRGGERAQGPAAAPACGLFLMGVRYPLQAGLDCASPPS